MRDIKFRAWDRVTQKMYQVQEMELQETCRHVVVEGYDCALVDPILLQYTGLRDKNGKEIYEGDIVRTVSSIKQFEDILTHMQIGEIVIDKGMTSFKGKTKQIYRDEINTHDSKFLFLSANIYEAIGNIYENEELITNHLKT